MKTKQTKDRPQNIKQELINIKIAISYMDMDLDAISIDLRYLRKFQNTLKENIKILTSNKVISIASYYYKSITELEDTKDYIKYYEDLKQLVLKKRAEKIQEYKVKLSSFEKERQHQLENNNRVILLFDPKRAGQKSERKR